MTPSIHTLLAETIAELVKAGHSGRYIADHLNRNNVPTLTGKGRWGHETVRRFAAKHGIGTPSYDAARIAAAQATKEILEPAPVALADTLEPTPEAAEQAAAYLATLTPEQNEYLARQKKRISCTILECQADARDQGDGPSAAAGVARRSAQALNELLEVLDSGDVIACADWAHWELVLMPRQLTDDELMEKRLQWLLVWEQLERLARERERDDRSAARRAERDPEGERLKKLHTALKRAQARLPAAAAAIAALRARIEAPEVAPSVPQDLFAKLLPTKAELRADLTRLEFKHAKSRRHIEELVSEIERLEAGTPA